MKLAHSLCQCVASYLFSVYARRDATQNYEPIFFDITQWIELQTEFNQMWQKG